MMSRFLLRCRDAERAILPGIRCLVCLLISVFCRILGIPVVKIVPRIDLYSDNYTKKKKTGFLKFRLDSGFQTGIHPESTRNRWGSVKTSHFSTLGKPLPLTKGTGVFQGFAKGLNIYICQNNIFKIFSDKALYSSINCLLLLISELVY